MSSELVPDEPVDASEIELTQEDIAKLTIYGELEIEHKTYGKVKIRLLLQWS